jgi:SAM-dependent methyltransferase
MIRQWVYLLRLAHRRFRSDADYQRFQRYQGNWIIKYLTECGIILKNALVLDLGCGKGGYSTVLMEKGARVVSVDMQQPEFPPSIFAQADAINLPFSSNSFPFIFCASLIEHIPEPSQLLAQIRRVLTPGGLAYLSFPPFLSPVGGHQFKPYHLLGERWALRLSGRKSDSFATACGGWGLYPLTIRHARQLFLEAGLKIVDESTRFMPLNLARLPWLGEFLTWHVQFILIKGE